VALPLDKGIDLISVDSPEAFVSDTPTAVLIRQILGAAGQLGEAESGPRPQAAGDWQVRGPARLRGDAT
jgi:hypothetical protein